MNEQTRQVDKIAIKDEVLKKIIEEETYKELKKLVAVEYEKATKELEKRKADAEKQKRKEYDSLKWIKCKINGESAWYCRETEQAIPVQKNYDADYKASYFGLPKSILSQKDVEIMFAEDDCPKELVDGIMASKVYIKEKQVSKQVKSGWSYRTETSIEKKDNGHCIGYGYDNTNGQSKKKGIVHVTDANGITTEVPDGKFFRGAYSIEKKKIYGFNDDKAIKVGSVYIESDEFYQQFYTAVNETIVKDEKIEKTKNIVKNNEISASSDEDTDKLISIFGIDKNKVKDEITKKLSKTLEMDGDILESFISDLLESDTKRAGLDKYDRKWLDDIKQGVWELWSDEKPDETKNIATLKKPLVSRNPAYDIHENGLIGIDFGTKSTIVSKQDGRKNATLIRIGVGQLSKEAQSHHYENPTIMEFLSLDKFLAAYNARVGRPDTCIDDLRVSHPAYNSLKSCVNSDFFYSFFYDIKQWCGDTERVEKIIDQKGIERILPSFVNLDHDEFNPLEIYAYYLGLYINNMYNGIFLDYVLSFPVTYEKSVKEKILESFKAGIKKSLPESIVNDKNIMAKFRVQQGVSEPAAYAITALKNYGFEPEDDEKYLYSIFDFGGGTTDFDFGIWRSADESRRDEEAYDYVIEHFGSEGDKYLGGENLLELLAFEVFKANARLLQGGKKDVGFSFSKPKECTEFAGSETLIANTQEARRNTKQLIEVLRPFWEGIISEDKGSDEKNDNTKSYKGYIFKVSEEKKFPIDDDGAITVDLFDKSGQLQSGFKLYIENSKEKINVDLIGILTNRIERGVASFFDAIRLAFNSQTARNSGVNEMQIFLAGNSSKSPILRKLFDKYIQDTNNKINSKDDYSTYFRLFPPLGTEEAHTIQKELGLNINTDLTAPTGKTGVAYGLIEGRAGGRIKVISEIKAEDETKFRYNIGIEKRGKFAMKLDRNDVVYGKWERFGNAGKELEFYYTSLPGANKATIDDSMNLRRVNSEIDIDKDIYIRAISPDELEYILSSQDSVPGDSEKGILIRLEEK